MSMISYAQNGEDVLLRRVFPDSYQGFYVDVGANDPIYHSVTKHFYERGWRGVNIEPLPAMYARLVADRPRDVTLHAGLADIEGTLTFHESESVHGWSTFNAKMASDYRERGHVLIERTVPVTTLAKVCETYAPEVVDFLKIDVEGFEPAVLRGGDWTRHRPRVVLIENAWPESWEHLILEANYLFAACDGINRYYVRDEEPGLLEHFRYPVNVADDYIPYGYHKLISDRDRMIAELRSELNVGHRFGPIALSVARRLRRLSLRHPKLAGTVKRVIRRRAS